eukprot:COSAG01_NODE_27109_length_694_cov_0.692437_2_plen_144_part_01
MPLIPTLLEATPNNVLTSCTKALSKAALVTVFWLMVAKSTLRTSDAVTDPCGGSAGGDGDGGLPGQAAASSTHVTDPPASVHDVRPRSAHSRAAADDDPHKYGSGTHVMDPLPAHATKPMSSQKPAPSAIRPPESHEPEPEPEA